MLTPAQRLWATLHTERGARIIGHKIGLTSRAMQMASNFNEPDFDHLLDGMLFAEGAAIPSGRFRKRRRGACRLRAARRHWGAFCSLEIGG